MGNIVWIEISVVKTFYLNERLFSSRVNNFLKIKALSPYNKWNVFTNLVNKQLLHRYVSHIIKINYQPKTSIFYSIDCKNQIRHLDINTKKKLKLTSRQL